MGNMMGPDMAALKQALPGSIDVFIIRFSHYMHPIIIFSYCQSSVNSILFQESNKTQYYTTILAIIIRLGVLVFFSSSSVWTPNNQNTAQIRTFQHGLLGWMGDVWRRPCLPRCRCSWEETFLPGRTASHHKPENHTNATPVVCVCLYVCFCTCCILSTNTFY